MNRQERQDQREKKRKKAEKDGVSVILGSFFVFSLSFLGVLGGSFG
jgi:hypothetical protein